jgi:hypothetical protein
MSLDQLFQLLNAGGNTALLAACWFIYRTAARLSRMEAMLELVLKLRGVQPPPDEESEK